MIQLDDDIRDRLARALEDGCPVVASSVDRDGQPHLSFFGTTQVHAPDQLAIWVRNPDAPTLQRLAGNPHIAFLYRHAGDRVSFEFHGRGRPVSDAEFRAKVYEQSPKVEQSRDPDRRGVAVLVDVDRVVARRQGESVEMSR